MRNLESPSGAVLSEDGVYRYVLWRRWGDGPRMMYCMLNPSTADALADDSTIRKCRGFAERNGCAAIDVVNLYAIRSRHPEVLLGRPPAEIIGPKNYAWWFDVLATADVVVAAWGTFVENAPAKKRPALPDFPSAARAAGKELLCLGRTKGGSPRHPLMPGYDTKLEKFDG